ncbi:SMI1/KNR4 family protein [Agrobacterium sp. SHOUNA12C]|uniref:SMI1/KNR4 family protein n=1 Tax=Rhizobium TaxID=379 RepID=UPI00026EC976|nr:MULTISPECIES: SMI1/KNR4 family protein [Rhizobium]MCJ9724901.1 SMI1/KNR4 family protein [Agrobacterium sp. BETTINA12B]MCJ9761475.1 SMI1/KNR4 family protein [Agrobacterium sp. SHOUNA12C]OCJ06236.1 hypothetical protein A6U85_04570 [Agrobacterium sp. 13-626]EJK87266.1 hypothetical protein PMI03_01275 [Rhizobium sp. AP16]KEA06935.1 hypothetical protein CN09_08110 [Rhizobium rhizogenes]
MTTLDAILRSGRVESFGKATSAALERLVNEHGVYLSQDYIHFLTRCNGLRTTFDFDEVKRVGLSMALADINTFYGVENGRDYADLLTIIPKMDASGRELLGFAPPIAVGGDFCTFVEITEGSRVGEIMYMDGEMYWGYFEEADTDWTNTPDALISTFIEHGFFMPIAPSFNALLEMYGKLV